MRNVYSVKQVNSYVKNMFSQDFMLNHIYVKGEVSNCKYHTSGHIYFSLKDESGTIACVMFASARSGLSFRMQEGQNVIVLGSVSVYERDGKYQLYAKEIILDGAGALYERFEALKKELEEMGMFAAEYKQPIPRYVKSVGIVTAPTGAAVRDIINISKRRNPYVQLILYPALVQGEGAAASIVRGIRMMEQQNVDVIIVGRGGGSMEDLWAFNEEAVARAIFECTIPIISAVGHETDTLISDYVADLRAPTPSAAAELAVYELSSVQIMCEEYKRRMYQQIRQRIDFSRRQTEQMAFRLKVAHPRQKLNEQRQYLADLDSRMRIRMNSALEESRHKLAIYIEKMKGLSPLQKLNQGYAYVTDKSGRTVRSIKDTKQGEVLDVYVTDGRVRTQVVDIYKEEYDVRREKE
ncbi:exodeoxyribonuclease VII large subunit [Firmicutes bacterium AM31-12AC]|uniref:exodeoxyribonuclease VII large subunit n=1 Tax=Mediterraneibacter sp. NSJ-151 TaxID=2897708 RepID=UPI000E4695B9|nr:exodeoxyribonuclease VII large subunit [Mediterraneibacter sp. NSJ-151]MCH4278879.1 exodeoxyribonuclease VII large subunit [Mediterraneibacter sp. NSJ-151]RHT40535.1 exodeoxyribonuclease VII large subunit [Firmicutes bacterium AM31-12AC]